MDTARINRRQLVAASGAAVAIHATNRLAVGAQTPVAAEANAVTTDTFGHEVAWDDPWMLDESLTPTAETDLISDDTDDVIGTVTYDRLALDHPDGGFGEMIFAPSPGEGEHWQIPYRWSQIDQYQIVDEGSAADFWYVLDFFVYEDAEYGRFAKGTYPEDSDHVTTVAFTAPVAGFGDALQLFLDDVTLDGEPPLTNVDPAGLQAALDPLVGTGLSASPVATPSD